MHPHLKKRTGPPQHSKIWTKEMRDLEKIQVYLLFTSLWTTQTKLMCKMCLGPESTVCACSWCEPSCCPCWNPFSHNGCTQ